MLDELNRTIISACFPPVFLIYIYIYKINISINWIVIENTVTYVYE